MSAQLLREDEPQTMERMDSPGKRLRIARQARGISQGDAATHLHLSVAMVQALEADAHEQLPGPVFVRGYIRNYGRLLGLDEAELLSNYRQAQPTEPDVRPVVRGGVRREVRTARALVKILAFLLILGAIGLLAAWWQGGLGRDDAPPGEEPAEPAATLLNPDGTLVLPPPDAAADAPPASLPGVGDAPEVLAPADPSTALAPKAEPAVPGVGASVPEEASATPLSVSDVGAPPEAPPAEGGPPDAESPASLASRGGTEAGDAAESGITFEFLGPCWVDIRDATRKFKLFGEMRKGDKRVLGGSPPYSVILGNSPMVRVTVDGKPYDIGAHARGSVARFTLDPGTLED
jgi:cytoskeleton protein RodZ